MEGIASAIIILGVLLFVIQANSLVVPQTEKSIDMKLGQTANDVITSMDWNGNTAWSPAPSLKSYVAAWNGGKANATARYGDPQLATLDGNITSMLPAGVLYDLEFIYTIHHANGSAEGRHDLVVYGGEPGDNSMVATRLVTINQDDAQASSLWESAGATYPQVVLVKIVCWHL